MKTKTADGYIFSPVVKLKKKKNPFYLSFSRMYLKIIRPVSFQETLTQ